MFSQGFTRSPLAVSIAERTGTIDRYNVENRRTKGESRGDKSPSFDAV
jgi:hypothetical protein